MAVLARHTLGDVLLLEVDADPNTVITAPLGSLATDSVTAALYINTDGATAWSTFTTGASSGWQDDGTVIRLITTSDTVNIGGTTMSGDGEKLRVEGDLLVDQGGCIILKTHAAFAASDRERCTFAVATADAVANTAYTLPIDDDSTYYVTARIQARDVDETGAAQFSAFSISVMAYRDGGGVATLGGAGVQRDFQDRGAAISCNFAVSGNNLLVTVTGKATDAINWSGTVEFQKVSVAA